ncbi:MAG: protein translocase subunit SecD [candidate division WOR-3 bacterium]
MKNLKWKWLFIFVLIGVSLWQLHYSFTFFFKDKEAFSKIPQNKQKIIKSRALHLGLDLQGGMNLLLEIDKRGLKEEELKGAINRALEILRNRIDELGVAEPQIVKQGNERIMIQLPGVVEPERAREIIGKTALLEFKLVREPEETYQVLNRINTALKTMKGDTFDLFSYFPPGSRAYGVLSPYKSYIDSLLKLPKLKEYIPYGDTIQWGKEVIVEGYKYYPLYVLKKEPLLTGSSILNAELGIGTEDNPMGYRVDLTMKKEYWRKWAQITGANVGRQIAIILDGIVQSAPVVRERIPTGRSQITMGSAPMEEAKTLAIILKAGALPAPLKIIEERSIGPSLGNDSIKAGIRSIILGTILVFCFSIIYYLKAGLIAIFGLILNVIFLLAILSGLRATLTLPGIAGIALTVGMAIDANVLIFERIREELKSGKTIRTAIVGAYQKVFITIFDANLTTFIAAIILFYFGTGPIKGFAVTLSIGLLASFFTAIFVTRNIFEFWILKGLKALPMLNVFKNPKVDFLKVKKWAFLFSGVLLFSGVVSLAIHRGPKYGVDFTGGSVIEVEIDGGPVTSEEMRELVSKAGFKEATIQKYMEKNLFLIKIKETEEEALTRLKKAIVERFAGKKVIFPRQELVGPAVSKGLQTRAIWVVLLGMLGILIYVWIRFDFHFGVASVVALLHDVLITIGLLSITNTEFNIPIIAGLLTILGYSINDSIVISDRIRENVKLMRGRSFPEVVNASLNQTLSRTIITSLTTLFVVFALFFLGGRILRGFSLCLLIGFIIGTYSSIFIVAPIVVEWRKKKSIHK